MFTSRLTISGDIGGAALGSTITREADGQIGHDVVLAAAVSGTVTTYNPGPPENWVLNLPGHGFNVNDVVDVYWAAGRRYGMKVTAVVGDDVTVENGTSAGGDTMPAVSTAITVAEQMTLDTDFDGNKLVAIGALCNQRGTLGFFNAGGTRVLTVDLTAREAWYWVNGSTAANPLAGQVVDKVVATQNDTAADDLNLGMLYDSTV
ncbi:MAG: hypothetical protein HRF50_17550 [Phycisphaerae bacterium]